MPKYPFMARRKGSKNFYYKRPVPKALRAEGRRKQIWRSLETDRRKAAAKVAYRKVARGNRIARLGNGDRTTARRSDQFSLNFPSRVLLITPR